MSAFPLWAAQADGTMAPEIWKPLPVGVGGEEITALALETPSKIDRATRRLAIR